MSDESLAALAASSITITSSCPSASLPSASPQPDSRAEDGGLSSACPSPADSAAADEEEEEPADALLGDITDSFTDDYSLHPPPRLRRAEAVLAHRTSRIVLVLEHVIDSLNHQAVLRTAEAMGIQHVWTVDSGERKAYTVKGGLRIRPTVTCGSSRWLTIRSFDNTDDCIAALRKDQREILVTSLGPQAEALTAEVRAARQRRREQRPPAAAQLLSRLLSQSPCRRSAAAAQNFPCLPARLCVVMGRELDGVSPAFLAAASRIVCLPQLGFTESFNVSVATALCLQRLLDLCPTARGDLSADEKRQLRLLWYPMLACRAERAADWLQWAERAERGELQWTAADLRVREADRLPRINKGHRQKLEQQGHRPFIINKQAHA